MTRPSFATTIYALEIVPTAEESDVAEFLRHVDATHQGGPERDAGSDTWGTCTTCRTPWPCREWAEAEQLAVLYLGRAHDRAAARARQTLDRAAERDRARRAAQPVGGPPC